MKKKHLFQLLVGGLISALALYLVLKGVSLKDLIAAFKSVNYIYLFYSMVAFYVSTVIRGIRWSWLFLPDYQVSKRCATESIFICFAFNSIFPARAGEFARAWVVGKKEKTGFPAAFGTVISERLIDVLVLIVLMLVSLAAVQIPETVVFKRVLFGVAVDLNGEKLNELKMGMFYVAALLSIAVVLVCVPRSRAWLLSLLRAVKFIPKGIQNRIEDMVNQVAKGLSWFHSPGHILRIIVSSLAVWILCALSILFLAWGYDFDTRMTVMQSFALLVIGCIFITIPATPGYWGLFEAGFIFGLMALGIHEDTEGQSLALSYAILLHFSQWLPVILIGLPLAWKSHISLDNIRSAGAQSRQQN